jgi:hypothetical protein
MESQGDLFVVPNKKNVASHSTVPLIEIIHYIYKRKEKG